MLDKQTSKLLKILNSFCKDGNYKVIDKREILETLEPQFMTSKESLDAMVEHLSERRYLNVKYSDKDVLCLAILPKGKLFDERTKEISLEKKKFNKNIMINIIVSSVCSFLGAIIGVLVSKIIL